MKIDNGEFLRNRAFWTCGGIDEEHNQFTTGTPHAWRLAEPLYMPSMTKVIYTVPKGYLVRAILCKKKEEPSSDVNNAFSFDISLII